MPSPPQDGDARLHDAAVVSLLVARVIAASFGEQVAELVDALHQAVARERLERETATRRPSAARSVAASRSTVTLGAGIGRSATQRGFVDHDRHQPVLQRVGAEDVGELAADHGADAEVQSAPRARARARSRSRSCGRATSTLRPAASGRLSTKSGFGRAIGQVAPVGEQLLAQAFARGGAQEARRDDLVGVDVRCAAAPRCASVMRADAVPCGLHSSSRADR